MVILLNTSILTTFGTFRYEPLALAEARRLVADGFISAIGHDSTANVLSELLGVAVPVNRFDYQQQPGEQAIVFKLKGRPPEGRILAADEIQTMGYEFGLLTRLE